MDDDTEKSREEKKCMVNASVFRSNAGAMIEKMLELNILRQDGDKKLVDEILHSIFFLGMINEPPFSPEEILRNKDFLAELKKQYPRPFDLCSSQLPRRSPFSCLLDMIVFLKGRENEDEIIKRLQEIIKPLNQKLLVSYAICVSQNKNPNSVCRYYGVSMSRMSDELCLIMIYASCLGEYWDSDVAGAVMTYQPNDTKHLDFDGTITLPQHVRCETFKLFKEGKVTMPPCIKCKNMFGLTEIDTDTHLAEGASAKSQIAARSSLTCSTSTPPPPDTDRHKTFSYGNCAEAESLSNLFKKDSEVRIQAPPSSEMGTDDNREMAAERVRTDLMKCLRRKHFTWDNTFYKPQL